MSAPKPTRWIRYRFHSESLNDPRPVQWPPKGPYWISGEGDGYAILIAYLPEGIDLAAYWPEASEIDEEPGESITYSSRFPKPVWWKE